MEDPKALKLFQEVLNKTKAGRIKWEPTADETQYSSILPSGHALLVSKYNVGNAWDVPIPDDFVLLLRDRDSEQELFRVTADVAGVGPGLAELYEFARRRALQVDATVDQVLGDLAKL